MEHVDVANLRIAYRAVGSGAPLLLLHGAFSDSRVWHEQIEGLSDELTVVAWDAPGCGQSSDPPESFRLPDYADCVAELIEALQLDRPHVLGLSFGGGLALELYRRHRELARSLVLASAYAGWAGSLPSDQVEERRRHAVQNARRPPADWARDLLPGLFTDCAPPEVVEELVSVMLDTRPAGMLPMLHGFAEADLRDVLPEVTIPTLLLYGELDRRSPLSVAEHLHHEIPTSRLVVLPDVGHASNLETPDAFNDAVRRFLREVDA